MGCIAARPRPTSRRRARAPGWVLRRQPHTYTDSTANLGVAPNAWYYVVAPEDSSNNPVGTSNRTGAFVFGLTPGN